MRPIVAYVKATNFCTVGCSHCYLPEEVRANRNRMSEEDLRQAGKLIHDMAAATNSMQKLVIWHGGEPMMLSPEYYYHAGDIITEEAGHVEQSIQTSLIPYQSNWANIVHERFNGFIGSSIDFSQRTIKGSTASYQKAWMKRVEQARSDGIVIIPGIVPSVDEVNKSNEIYLWMKQHNFEGFNIDRYNHFGFMTSDRPSNIDHATFLTGLFQATMNDLQQNDSAIKINVITSILQAVLFGLPGDRWGTTCQSDFVVIEPDGKLNNCPDKISFEQSYGRLKEGWKSFRNSKGRRSSVRESNISHKKTHCMTCENSSWCKSGCPITPNQPESEGDCSGYKTHINFVREWINKKSCNLDLANQYLEISTTQNYGAVT